ncbi:hypothetical protein ACFP3Q_17325 [Nocardioides sp. GCM10027113]|uniref:hypothetical protein n=1 Tax=unclassified Nocardioides TaxID=2615069 RepID=UPI00360A1EB1
MRPLQSIAMGLVVIGLRADLAGYDLLPDPLGWVLVLAGVAAVTLPAARRTALLATALLAALVSVPLWLPGAVDRLDVVHPSLVWAANLPQLGFTVLLCLTLANEAAESGDRHAVAWLRTTASIFVVVALLPVVVFGGGVASLEVPSYLAATLALLLLVWLLFTYARRPWVVPAEPPQSLRST